MPEENKPEVSRRRLLRRAGTLAAGAGAAGIAGAAVGSPAQADDGDTLLIGRNTNVATSTTVLTGGNTTNVTLNLANTTDGPSLTTKPVVTTDDGTAPFTPAQVPVGTIFADQYGDMHVTGADEFGAFSNMLYSPTWAYTTIPLPQRRIIHTWNGYQSGTPWGIPGRKYIVPGSATYDSLGRVVPRSGTGPDLVIDLRTFISYAPHFAAVQGVLIIENSWNDTGGRHPAAFAGLWDEGAYPSNTSISYSWGSHATSAYGQTRLGSDGLIRLKLSSPGMVVFDICGFVLKDPFVQFGPDMAIFGSAVAGAAGASASGAGLRNAPLRKR